MWFCEYGGAQKGPFGKSRILELLQSGEITNQTLVWKAGMADWRPIGDIAELTGRPEATERSIEPVPPPRSSVPPTPSAASPPPPPVPMPDTGAAPEANRWRRYFARSLDVVILSIPFWLVQRQLVSSFEVNANAVAHGMNALVLLAAVPVLALLESTVGTTPGKYLLGLKVVPTTGVKDFAFSLSRELGVFLKGWGLGIPIVSLVTLISQFRRLKRGEPAAYDVGKATVLRIGATSGKTAAAIVLASAIIGTNIFFNFLPTFAGPRGTPNQAIQFDPGTHRNWQNPVTGRKVDLNGDWKIGEQTRGAGRLFQFLNEEADVVANFGVEKYGTIDGGLKGYASALQSALAKDIELKSDWKEVLINGKQALIAYGKYKPNEALMVTITVQPSDKSVWRVVTFVVNGNSSGRAMAGETIKALLASI